MIVAELEYPGTRVQNDEAGEEWAHNTQRLLSMMEGALADLCIALSKFRDTKSSPPDIPDTKQWETDAQRRREIEQRLIDERDVNPYDFEARDEVRQLARRELKREKWQDGHVPRQYQTRTSIFYARSFMYAADRIRKLLKQLSERDYVPGEVNDAHTTFTTDVFPELTGVRNSVAHIDERVLGQQYGEEIDLQSVDVEEIQVSDDSEVLITEALLNNRFGCTMGNGQYGEVAVSLDAVAGATACIQRAINAFDWRGPNRHYPT